MINIKEKILASKNMFFIYLASFYTLWIGKHITNQYLPSLGKEIFSEHLVGQVFYFDSLFFVFTICQYLFAIQLLMLILGFVFNIKKPVDKSDRSLFLETIFASLIFLNSSLIILLMLIGSNIFIPSKGTIFIILLSVTILSFAISYFLSSGETDNDFWKGTIWKRLRQFGFPHSREVFAISWALAVFISLLQFHPSEIHNSFQSWLTMTVLPFMIAVAGIIYLVLGSIFRVARLDELERHIYNEKSSIVFLILAGVMLFLIMLGSFFQINFEFTDFGIIIGPAILISDLFVRAKYI